MPDLGLDAGKALAQLVSHELCKQRAGQQRLMVRKCIRVVFARRARH